MIEPKKPSLPCLLPEILSALSDHFSHVECVMESCPNLSLPPHNLSIKIPGEIHLIPESTPSTEFDTFLKNSKKLTTIDNFLVIATESHPSVSTLKITLHQNSSKSTDWFGLLKTKLKKYLNDENDFLFIETTNGKSKFCLLQNGKTPEIQITNEIILWLAPVAKVHKMPENSIKTFAADDGVKKVVKKKIVKRVVKKKVPGTTPTSTENSPTPEPGKKSSTASIDSENGFKLVKKPGSKETSPVVVEKVVEDVSSVSYLVKMGQIPAEDGLSLKDEHFNGQINGNDDKNGITNGVEKKENGMNGSCDDERRGSKELPPPGITMNTAKKFDETVNGIKPEETKNENIQDETAEDKSVLSSVSETISSLSSDGATDFLGNSTPMSPVIKVNDILSSDDEGFWLNKWPRPGNHYNTSSTSSAANSTTPTPLATTTLSSTLPTTTAPTSVISGFLSSVAGSLGFSRGTSPASSRLSSIPSTLTPISSESNLPGRLNGLRHSDSNDFLRSLNSSNSTLAERLNNRRRSSSGIRGGFTSSIGIRDRLLSPPFRDSRESTPLFTSSRPQVVRGMKEVPVLALQEVLKTLTFQELGEYRRVHPHWDELCGQLLNAGYYQLVQKADSLLQDCQRRVYTEKDLQVAITALTSLQVQVLNQVDMMRAPMDEGVLCFPYGLLLDKAFDLLKRIERVVERKDDAETAVLPTSRLIEMARKAQYHYRKFVEPEVEKRMSEVSRLQATARLQRIDSFLVETQVTKLERETEQTKSDLQWEIEQLKQQNSQLKKDNREMKNNQARLESRIEVLERKFKTMARLLQ